jgi:hypothetical protein
MELETGHIYIIESEEGPIKIGMSVKPEERIAGITTASGRVIRRKFISPAVPEYWVLESVLHKHFAKFRTVGEWFTAPYAEAVHMAHLLGARLNPDSWKVTDRYIRGAVARKRIWDFSEQERTPSEWDAFLAGMGQDAYGDYRFADELDIQFAGKAAERYTQALGETMRLHSALGLPTIEFPQSAWDRLREIEGDIERALLGAGGDCGPVSES